MRQPQHTAKKMKTYHSMPQENRMNIIQIPLFKKKQKQTHKQNTTYHSQAATDHKKAQHTIPQKNRNTGHIPPQYGVMPPCESQTHVMKQSRNQPTQCSANLSLMRACVLESDRFVLNSLCRNRSRALARFLSYSSVAFLMFSIVFFSVGAGCALGWVCYPPKIMLFWAFSWTQDGSQRPRQGRTT